MTRLFLTLVGSIGFPSIANAYTPLITSTTFDGVNADVNAVAMGMIGLFIVVAAVGLIVRGMMGR